MRSRRIQISSFTLALMFGTAGAQAQQQPDPVGARGGVTGSGTTNFIPKWTNTSSIGNSAMFQNGTNIGINTQTPGSALDVAGDINISGGIKWQGISALQITGSNPTGSNTGLGVGTLMVNTATANTAIGYNALLDNNSGVGNTAIGVESLLFNTGGGGNTAIGVNALAGNTTGSYNTAIGLTALNANKTGVNNIAIGPNAAQNAPNSSSNNIHIGSLGLSSDNGTIRIGATAPVCGTCSVQTSFFAAGIYGVQTGLPSAVPVMIDSNNQLGTINSSRRYKENIQDMGDASSSLLKLRPVTFRYEKPFADGSKPIQYGLIAEEVEEVFPDLVARSADGQIETVKYQVLDSLLLNEVQRLNRENQDLQQRLAKLEAAMEKVATNAPR
ncbi:MAG: hypothetical protein C5B51_26365 [Terriglobia bacterium]|nr:MAG: hypothetical protein C5B51_26365 [Terriglobia bacterium]